MVRLRLPKASFHETFTMSAHSMRTSERRSFINGISAEMAGLFTGSGSGGVSARTILAQDPSGLPEFSQRFQAVPLPLAASEREFPLLASG